MLQNGRLNRHENSWLERMLSSNFAQRDEIVKQINQADIVREYTDYYLRIKFIVVSPVQSCGESTGVPVEMRAYMQNEAPIQFLLHIEKGVVTELEVFKADSSKISSEIHIDNARIEIIINPAIRQPYPGGEKESWRKE